MVRELIERGLREHQAGRLSEANSLYEQALIIEPRHPDALHLAGVLAFQSGAAERAIGLLEQAVAVQPANPAFHGNLAQVYLESQRVVDAHAAFQRALHLDRTNPRFATGAAICLALQGRLAEAEHQLRGVVQRHARFALGWFNLGNTVRDQGRMQEALECFQRTVELDSALPDAWNNLGHVLHQLERFAEAEQCFREHLARQPDSAAGYANLASVLTDSGRFSEAEAVCRHGIARSPGAAERPKLQRMLGAALAHQGKLKAMLEADRAAAVLAPADARAQWSYGYALVHTGREDEGFEKLEQALKLDPDAKELRGAAAGLYLARGDLRAGWAAYESRLARGLLAEKFPELRLVAAMPGDWSGRTICLMREQGLGDNLFFLRYAQALKSRGARITCLSNQKIASLLGRVPALDEVLPQEEPPPDADLVALVGSLPYLLGQFGSAPYRPAFASAQRAAGATLPPRLGYARLLRIFHPELPPPLALPPLPDRLDEIKRRLDQAGPPPYIGITWRAGTPPAEQRGTVWVLHKNAPLEGLGACLRGLNGTLLSLQRHPRPGETEQVALRAGRPVHDFNALNEDLESMLALLALLDDYVGVSNTNMHLRAGAGRPARVLVPRPVEWRWMAAGDTSPWFPGFRLYRQRTDGDWGEAFEQLRKDLAAAHGKP